jgi:hypothetical protein
MFSVQCSTFDVRCSVPLPRPLHIKHQIIQPLPAPGIAEKHKQIPKGFSFFRRYMALHQQRV